jgi:hypothetical protein
LAQRRLDRHSISFQKPLASGRLSLERHGTNNQSLNVPPAVFGYAVTRVDARAGRS